jgi:hypothetical protein
LFFAALVEMLKGSINSRKGALQAAEKFSKAATICPAGHFLYKRQGTTSVMPQTHQNQRGL